MARTPRGMRVVGALPQRPNPATQNRAKSLRTRNRAPIEVDVRPEPDDTERIRDPWQRMIFATAAVDALLDARMHFTRIRREAALQLAAEGVPTHQIAEALGVTPSRVRLIMHPRAKR